MSFAPAWAAQSGYDEVAKKCDTSFSYSSFGSGNDSLTAVLSGSAQATIGTGAGQVMKAVAQGKQLKYVANAYNGVGVLIIARKALEPTHGTDFTKFSGLTWGYTSEGSATQILMETTATHFGMNWDALKHAALGSTTALLPALQSGRVDIVTMDSSVAAKAVAGGFGYVVLNANDADQYRPIAGGSTMGTGLVFNASFVEQYPVLVQEIVTAFVEGLLKLREATADQAFAAMPAFFTEANSDRAAFDQQWQYAQPSFFHTNGNSPPAAVLNTAKQNLTPEQAGSPAIAETFDNRFVEQAYKDLGVTVPAISS